MSINAVFDAACPSLVVLTEEGQLPETMFVHPVIFRQIADIRLNEQRNGLPLMVLGMMLKPDVSLPENGYRFSS